jgi:hypothetical protein
MSFLFHSIRIDKYNYQPILIIWTKRRINKRKFDKIKKIFKKISEEISFTGKSIDEQPKFLMMKYKQFQCLMTKKLFLLNNH